MSQTFSRPPSVPAFASALKRLVAAGQAAEAVRRFSGLGGGIRPALAVHLAAQTERDPAAWIALLELLEEQGEGVAAHLDEAALVRLILVVKHHRPRLALGLLIRLGNPGLRRSLGDCLAQLWSRRNINEAWNAVARSGLSAAERLALHSRMI